ncbi:MAG: glycosyltransferase family A protein [bacterium]|nr:glycosyltransferase family A protein [bacterium]
MAKVSVIIPTCNRPELLARAVASVKAQTFQDLELIIEDDGQTKRGGAATRNLGASQASGEYLAFLDDDDEWLPDKLLKQVTALKAASTDTTFCFTAVTNVYDDHEERTQVPAGVGDYLPLALKKFNGFLTSTLLIRKSSFEAVGGFDESFPSHQEPDLIIRLSQQFKGLGVNEPLVKMSLSRGHEHIGSKLERRIAGREKILTKHQDLFNRYPKVLAKHLFNLGLWYRNLRETKKARINFYRAWQNHHHPRYLVHYGRSFLGY